MFNRFASKGTLAVAGQRFTIYRLRAVAETYKAVDSLPYTLKILLENLLRTGGDRTEIAGDIEALATWEAGAEPGREIAFTPSRVLHQDFTGVPSLVDLAAMRDAVKRLGGDPGDVNPRQPVELVIDHSIQVENHGTAGAFAKNSRLEFARNRERYGFLRWGQTSFKNFRIVPPQTGIVHQVNLEHLARVVFTEDSGPEPVAYPDTVVGTDSHTTMVNGLGVLGWGCGGIEAEAVMLGEPITMLIPQVVGVELTGELTGGATATDLVLTITEMLRKKGVVGKFVEFFGSGLPSLSLADRATVANMAPEYGATCGLFPIDGETLRYLRVTGRTEARVALVEAYARDQGLFHGPDSPRARYSDTLALDLGTVEASVAGPKRPQDRLRLGDVKSSFLQSLPALRSRSEARDHLTEPRAAPVTLAEKDHTLRDGSVVIAAITSCTNTSNPWLLLAAGMLAQNAVARGLAVKPWVKTSFAPGSRTATEYLAGAGLMTALEQLGFFLVGYGCTTCVGNSGPLVPPVARAIAEHDLVVTSVLSGNRNFEGRVHPAVRASYLASPPLVVAYALAGRVDIDLNSEPLGKGADGAPVYLRDLWPSRAEIASLMDRSLDATMFRTIYNDVFTGNEHWRSLEIPGGELYGWPDDSTYIKNPPYFDDMTVTPPRVPAIEGARVLALLGDSITTDHISPVGPIAADSPAGRYLVARGVDPGAFNGYGARRGNHEVMVRGTFASVRLKNQLVPGIEGGFTRHVPSGETMTIFEAAMRYAGEGVPLLVIGGKQYGTGSSRDWAAKGSRLLGVRAVLAESFERIHRSNLIGMGIVPLEFRPGQSARTLGLSGEESYDIAGLSEAIASGFAGGREVTVRATGKATREFRATVRIDTPREALYYQHGGILHYVIRQLLGARATRS